MHDVCINASVIRMAHMATFWSICPLCFAASQVDHALLMLYCNILGTWQGRQSGSGADVRLGTWPALPHVRKPQQMQWWQNHERKVVGHHGSARPWHHDMSISSLGPRGCSIKTLGAPGSMIRTPKLTMAMVAMVLVMIASLVLLSHFHGFIHENSTSQREIHPPGWKVGTNLNMLRPSVGASLCHIVSETYHDCHFQLRQIKSVGTNFTNFLVSQPHPIDQLLEHSKIQPKTQEALMITYDSVTDYVTMLSQYVSELTSS